jgi:hypothetical protein
MSVLERVRASGKFPPSLLRDSAGQDDFEAALLKVVDTNNGTSVVRFFGGNFWIARNSRFAGVLLRSQLRIILCFE